MCWPLVKYVLTAALRDKVLFSLIVILALGVSLSIFMGSAAVVEQDRFAVVFAAGGLRLAGVLGLVLFVVVHVRRSFETKDVEFLLSRPIGRIQFLVSFALAFSILAALMGLATGMAIYVLGPHIIGPGYFLWVLSIVIENIIMVNAALFFSMLLTSSATAAMVTLAFYVLARMMGQLLGIVDAGGAVLGDGPLPIAMQMVSVVTPRLDLMGQTSWLVYGPDQQIGFIYVVIQGCVFTCLVLLASLLDLMHRKF